MLTRIFSSFILFIIPCTLILNSASKDPVRANNAMVASEHELATKIGVEILKQGGNAIDAAVAVGFALAVTYPEAGNIGGGGFMVIHLRSGINTTIDYREKAPKTAYTDMFLDEQGEFDINLSTEGWSSSGAPGSVAGMIYALAKYGTMDIKDVIQQSIELAENGFELDDRNARLFKSYFREFSNHESTKKIFTKNNSFYEAGDLFVQKDLANTLKLIRDYGHDGFYSGTVAGLIAKQSQECGGYITIDDLMEYHAVEREPVESSYRGLKVVSMGPSSSGGIALIQSLNILENFQFELNDWASSKYVHTVSEALKYVYADRSEYLGDIDYYPVPISYLTSKEYAKKISSFISDIAVPSDSIRPGLDQHVESENTTHYCVIDQYGNAVSVTTTINSLFGNKIIVEGAGFFMNNEMDDFSSKPGTPNQFGLMGGEANSIKPGKRMLSAMTPTILLKDENPFMLVGARGGSRIITAVLQTILNVVDFNMDIQQAIDMPRFHHQWYPNKIDYESFGLTLDVKDNLISMGHSIGEKISVGIVVGILVDPKTGMKYGAVDSRSNGLAEGY